MVSPSEDGEIVVRIASTWGYTFVRGSGSHSIVRAWAEMKRELERGGAVIHVPDGPKGPDRKLKMGAIKLAQQTGAYLVPFTFSATKKKLLRSWDNFMGWLYRITANLSKNWLRSQSRRPDGEFVEDQEPEVLDRRFVNFYHENAMYDSIREALDSLPEIYRQVLMLRYFGGMTIREMSRFIGVSPATIKRRLKRAQEQMKEEILATMSASYEQNELPESFTFSIVEMVKRIRVHPLPRVAGLPWGLSLAAGIIVTVLSLNPNMSIQDPASVHHGSPLSSEAKMLKTGEVPVEVLRTSRMPLTSSRQGDGNGGILRD